MAQKRNRARRFGCAVAVSALQAPTVAPRRTNLIVNGGRTATPLGRTKTLAGKEKIVASVQEDIEGADLIYTANIELVDALVRGTDAAQLRWALCVETAHVCTPTELSPNASRAHAPCCDCHRSLSWTNPHPALIHESVFASEIY